MSTIQVGTIAGYGRNQGRIVMQGDAHLNANGTMSLGANGNFVVPVGTTDERPSNPAAGMLRFNSSFNALEVFNGTEWVGLTISPPAAPPGEDIIVVELSDYTLVYVLDSNGDVRNPNTIEFGEVGIASPSVAFTPYVQINNAVEWKQLKFTGVNKPWVQHIFNRTEATEDVLESLCNPYSAWVMNNNSGRYVVPAPGSNKRVGQRMVFQHNNGGGETHDIPTLATNTNVWGNSMIWGQIDSTSNYGGILNTGYGHSGSSGGATGDKILVYVSPYMPDDDASDFENYMTPNGPLGNAQNFSMSVSASTDDGSSSNWGTATNVFDAVSRNTTSSWQSYGIQLRGDNCYIQVDLGVGNATKFDYTFVVGYPNGSHHSNENYLDGSNDGVTWTRLNEWEDHNGGKGNGYLTYNSGNHTYANTLGNIGKWHAINNETAFRYYRLGGTGFNSSNGYMLVFNWALMKRREGNPPRKLYQFDSNDITIWLDASNHAQNDGDYDWEDKSGNQYDAYGGSWPSIRSDWWESPHFSFNGSSNYMPLRSVNYGNGSNNGTISELSIFAWIRTTYNNGNTGTLDTNNWAIIDFDRSEVFNMFIGGGGDLQFAGYSSNAGGFSTYYDIQGTRTDLNDGFWHYVGVVFSTSDQTIKFYVDGVLDRTHNANGNMTALGARSRRYGFLGDGSEAGSQNSSRNNIYYDGDIAEVHMWDDRRLTDAEITNNWNATKHKYGYPTLEQTDIVTDGLEQRLESSLWSGSGTWFDTSNQGTTRNANFNGNPQKVGDYIEFDGNNDWVTWSAFTVSRTDGAVSCWINIDDFNGRSGSPKTVNSRMLWGDNGYGYNRMVALYGNGSYGFETDNNSDPVDMASDQVGWSGVKTQLQNIAGTWINFAMSYCNNRVKVYVNGVEIGDHGVAANVTYDNFGWRTTPNNYPHEFKGKIGQILYYRRSLTGADILHNFNVTKGDYGL